MHIAPFCICSIVSHEKKSLKIYFPHPCCWSSIILFPKWQMGEMVALVKRTHFHVLSHHALRASQDHVHPHFKVLLHSQSSSALSPWLTGPTQCPWKLSLAMLFRINSRTWFISFDALVISSLFFPLGWNSQEMPLHAFPNAIYLLFSVANFGLIPVRERLFFRTNVG